MEKYTGFNPIVHGDDQVLILGSMPSIKSIEENMYYANPNNRFWVMLGNIFEMEYKSREDKFKILEANKIALWDICYTCFREKSSDSSIQKVVANDIEKILKDNPSIQKVICNGKTSFNTLKRFFPQVQCVVCPSTSSANARYGIEDLVKEYEEVLK